MDDPYLFGFRTLQVIGTIGTLISTYVTWVQLRLARKVTATVVSGSWRTTFVEQSTGREHQYWFPLFEYAGADGQMTTTTTDLGYRSPLPIGTSVRLSILRSGTIVTNRFREKWMWTLIFAVPAVFFSFAWFTESKSHRRQVEERLLEKERRQVEEFDGSHPSAYEMQD